MEMTRKKGEERKGNEGKEKKMRKRVKMCI